MQLKLLVLTVGKQWLSLRGTSMITCVRVVIYSVEQSTSMDNCVDLTTGNDNIVRDCSTSATESSRMEPSSTFNPTDDSITKVSHCFREDFKIKGCPDASSSKKGKTVSGEGSNVRV